MVKSEGEGGRESDRREKTEGGMGSGGKEREGERASEQERETTWPHLHSIGIQHMERISCIVLVHLQLSCEVDESNELTVRFETR